MSKIPRTPSLDAPEQEEHEIEEEGAEQQHTQQHGAAQGATGLTGLGLNSTVTGAAHPLPSRS